jgi:hypothetical protein
MESRRLSIRVPDPLLNHFQSYLDQQGLTVTEGVLAAIASYVGDNERSPGGFDGQSVWRYLMPCRRQCRG